MKRFPFLWLGDLNGYRGGQGSGYHAGGQYGRNSVEPSAESIGPLDFSGQLCDRYIDSGRPCHFYAVSGGFSDGASLVGIAEFILASIMIAVTLIVVAVPEGLPMSVTVSLALSMRKMLKENDLVRKLHACETMGAATVICTDKTGTLTKNRMTVLETDLYGGEENMELVRQNMAVNSTAEVFKEKDGTIVTIGNPTEAALLKWLSQNGTDYQEYRKSADVKDQMPFSTERKYKQAVASVRDSLQEVRFIKGAPEIQLDMCDSIAGGVTREEVLNKLAEYQSKAMRTLGFASEKNGEGLVFSGILGIADPVRDDVKEVIETCKDRAGVRVIIVTGDTPGTANEIGRQIGLVGQDEPNQTVAGVEFASMPDSQAQALVASPDFKIISRARPEDKARLVRLLQANKEVVAVTGDGTNDAPALSKAHVGLSMGDGTSRAKEARPSTMNLRISPRLKIRAIDLSLDSQSTLWPVLLHTHSFQRNQ